MIPPRFSIIVPVYNVERYLQECVDSILAQTVSDFELILVNDGSTDKSGEICDTYSEKDSRVSVIHQANAGSSTARNRGIENARGQYISFIDSDDTITSRYLEAFLPGIEKDAELCVQGLIEHVEGQETYKKEFTETYHLSVVSALDAGMLHFRGPVCKLFCADIIRKYNIAFPKHIVYGEDAVFFYSYLSHVSTVYSTAECCYYYRKGIESVTRRKHDPTALLDYLEFSVGKVTEIYQREKKSPVLPDSSTLVELKGILANMISCSYSSQQISNLITRIRKSENLRLAAFPYNTPADRLLITALRWAPVSLITHLLKIYFK